MPEGLSVHHDWIDARAESELLAAIDAAPWRDDLTRRVQHYGWRYDYRARVVRDEDYIGPLPSWSTGQARRLSAPALMGQVPDQLIVNEYEPGQGISAHVDRLCFGPVVVSLCLGSACVMKLTPSRRRGSASPSPAPVDLVLPRRALLVLRGPARTSWRHAIPARKSDVIGGARVPRQRRVSLTFRTVVRPAT